MSPLEPADQIHLFRVAPGSGVWRVSRDGDFFGDYLSRGDAIRAAYAAARFEEARGLMAQVFEPPGLTPLPHHEPHLGK